jgi:outer membrane protein TolC
MLRVFLRAVILSSLGLALFVLPVHGQDTTLPLPEGTLDLQDVLAIAIRRSPQLLESLAEYRLARLQLDEVYLARNPTVDLTYDFIRQSQEKHGINEEETELTINQLLWDFGKVRWEAKAARLAAYQSAEELRTEIEVLAQEVAGSFVEVKLAEQNVKVAQDRLDDRKTYLTYSQELFRAGEIAGYEVVQAESSVLSAEQDIEQENLSLEQAKAALRVQLLAPPGCPLNLAELPEVPEPDLTVEEGLQIAYERRPELIALRWGLESAQANVKAQGRQNLPTLSLLAELDDEREVRSNLNTKNWQVGLELSWSLYDGGVAANAAKQAQAQADSTQAQLLQAKNKVTSDVVNAHLKLVSLWQQIKTAKKVLAKAEETDEIAQKRYKAGYSSGIELLQAQDSLTDARTSLALAQGQYRMALIDWKRAISDDFPISLPDSLKETVKVGEQKEQP